MQTKIRAITSAVHFFVHLLFTDYQYGTTTAAAAAAETVPYLANNIVFFFRVLY